jgi:hypothetical protein
MRLRVGVFLVVACAVFAAAPSASAVVYPVGEPPFTKTRAGGLNTFWWYWDLDSGSSSEQYCFSLEQYNGSNWITTHNFGCYVKNPVSSGYIPLTPPSALSSGTSYATYVSRSIWDGSAWIPYPQTYICDERTRSQCRVTTIDGTAPGATVWVNGTAEYTNNPVVDIHIEYADAVSPPWPGTFACVSSGTPCTPSGFSANCNNAYRIYGTSYPNHYGFDCGHNASSFPDGPVYACAIQTDSAVLDSATDPSPFRSDSFNSANKSAEACGYVILDRQPPTVSISASDTNPVTGSLVTFTANVGDGSSGVNPAGVAWDLNNDGTTDKTGQTVTYTYTTPATFDVTAKVSDGAGNVGTGTVRIGVHAPGQPAPGYTPPPAAPGSAGACTINGTVGNDVLKGTPGKDIICGSSGNDKIYGLGGNDILRGGPGNDTLIGGPGNDVMNGEAGKDKLLAKNAGNDKLNGGPQFDSGSWNKKDKARLIERRLP